MQYTGPNTRWWTLLVWRCRNGRGVLRLVTRVAFLVLILLLVYRKGLKWEDLEGKQYEERVKVPLRKSEVPLAFGNSSSISTDPGLGYFVSDYLQYDEVFSNQSQFQWPLLMFSTMGRLGNCLSSYATALTFHGHHAATISVEESILKSIARLLDRQYLTLPVVGHELLLDMVDMGVTEVVRPDYLRDDMVSHLLPTILRAIQQYQKDGLEKAYLLEGYPNRMELLADHHHTIRSNLRIRPDLQAKAKLFLEHVRVRKGHDVTFVGVHIRRGDYVNFMKSFYNCSVPGPSYYHAALDHYRRALTSSPVFVVCSDDLAHARFHLGNATDVVYSDLTEVEEDLALLAACSHSIMTVGSFGFWASYLTGGQVVYPLLDHCTHTPYVHPDSLGTRGFNNWHPLPSW